MAYVWLPVVLFVLTSTALAVGLLVIGKLFGPSRTSAVKEMPYESGMDPIHDTRRRFDIRYHLIAIDFLIFDVELLFLYPWAVASRNAEGLDMIVAGADGGLAPMVSSRGLIFAVVAVFFGLLTLGFLYGWRKGVFQWR